MIGPIHFLNTLKKRWVLIVAITVIVVGVVLFFSFTKAPAYSAKATCMVISAVTGDSQYAVVEVIQQLMQTISTVAVSRPVLEGASKNMGNVASTEQLQKTVSSQVITNTQIIEITATSGNAKSAMLEANAVVNSLISYFDRQNGPTSTYKIVKVEPAVVPTSPTSPKPVRNGIIGVVLGLLVGVVCAFVVEYMSI